MLEVLEPGNQEVAVAVLKYDASALVETVEVLHCGDDGVGSVVGVDVDPHGQTGLVGRRLGQQQLEAHILGLDVLGGRQTVMGRPRFGAGIYIHDACVLALRQQAVVGSRPSLVRRSARDEVLDALVGDLHIWPYGRGV